MKKILITLIGIVILGLYSWANSQDNNSSKESNETEESVDTNISKFLMIDLDKLKESNGLKGATSTQYNLGTIYFTDNNDEVHVKGWINDEVSDKGICFNGSKRTLYRGSFTVNISKEGNSSFKENYDKRDICISTSDIKKGDTLQIINSKDKILGRFDIKKL